MVRTAFSRSAPASIVPVRTAFERSAPVRIAFVRFASTSKVNRKSVFCKLASTKFASIRFALERSAPASIVPESPNVIRSANPIIPPARIILAPFLKFNKNRKD